MNNISKEKDVLNLWFNNIKDLGDVSKRKLLNKLGTIENVREASYGILCNILDENKAGIIINNKSMEYALELWDMLIERNIGIVYPGHSDYPEKLLNIYDPPLILYIKGILRKKLNIYNMNVGIVGARKASVYGREVAEKFGYELAKKGINIISGLALGIDGRAHWGALKAGGYTVGVLGCGIDVIYPRENYDLFEEMSKKGAIISEYGPGVTPNPGLFPIRNRIISGLSDGLLVVEARKKSGSLITADVAVEQGKQVYSIPGKITDTNSEGTNNLIKQGAYLVSSPGDIVNDLCGKTETEDKTIMEQKNETVNKNSLAPAEKMLYSCLSLEPMYIDDIIEKLKLSVSETISLLYNMEEKGLIKQPLMGYYIISM